MLENLAVAMHVPACVGVVICHLLYDDEADLWEGE